MAVKDGHRDGLILVEYNPGTGEYKEFKTGMDRIKGNTYTWMKSVPKIRVPEKKNDKKGRK